jgi:ATP-dependent RNA helicase DHX8/PRP22
MADADIYSLEFLSLVAKITQEIDNHIGINNKTAAEFLINLHDGSNQSLVAFKAKVKEIGLEFPDSFLENVDRLILSMHPKFKKRHAKSTNGKAKAVDTELSELDRKKRLFPGLAVKDKDVPPVTDDVFLQELGDLVSGRKTRPHLTDDSEPAPKRQRRSASPRRSLSPRGRNDRWGNRNGGGRPMDNKPILFKIYGGKVTGLKDFGAFVTLEGVSGRVEGTVTILIIPFSDSDSFDRHGSCL